MTETHKPAPGAGEAGLGHNEPPPDPFLVRLEEDNADLVASTANTELESYSLPETVDNDDQVKEITDFVVKARNLARQIETRRKTAKEEPLKMTRTIDGFFSRMVDQLASRARTLEQRSAAYLTAKRARQEAEARAAAERARQEEARKAEEARLAREAKLKAEEEAAAARKALEEANDAAARAEAEAKLREAATAITDHAMAAEEAEKEAASAGKAADRNEAVADGGHVLAKTGSAGNVRVKTVIVPRVISTADIMKSMGPLGPYFPWAQVEAAINRAAKEQKETKLEVPGVAWDEREEVKTSAKRTSADG